jgi:hypothetical protein
VRTEPICREVRTRLTDDFLAHRQPDAGDLAHARACPACGAHRADLRALAEALDSAPAPELRPELASAVQHRAAEALAVASPIPRPAEAGLPPGYRRELARLLLWTALPLPALLLWYAVLFRVGGSLLAGLLPDFLVVAIGFALASGATSWLALIYGSIPFVAHRQAVRRQREVMA